MKRIDKLTPEQESRMVEWRDKWIEIGLQTGETDWETGEEQIKLAYEKAKIDFPNKPVIRVQSPLVGAFASSIANKILKSGAVRGAVDGAVGDAVGGAVRDAVRDAVGDAVHDAKLDWHYWLGGQFWVGGWWGSPSYVSFFTEVCGLELDKDIQERATIYDKLCRSVNYIWANRNFVMICARPIRICREDGRLHSDQVKAIEYPDGWGLYALDGVVLPKDLWKRIVSKEMSLSEIMAIEISDQRTVALKYNPQAIIKENAQLIHKDDRNNELYLVENSEINKITEFPKMYFLKMLCPTGRVFIEGVDPAFAEKHQNATECQAELCGLTLSEYQMMDLES